MQPPISPVSSGPCSRSQPWCSCCCSYCQPIPPRRRSAAQPSSSLARCSPPSPATPVCGWQFAEMSELLLRPTPRASRMRCVSRSAPVVLPECSPWAWACWVRPSSSWSTRIRLRLFLRALVSEPHCSRCSCVLAAVSSPRPPMSALISSARLSRASRRMTPATPPRLPITSVTMSATVPVWLRIFSSLTRSPWLRRSSWARPPSALPVWSTRFSCLPSVSSRPSSVSSPLPRALVIAQVCRRSIVASSSRPSSPHFSWVR